MSSSFWKGIQVIVDTTWGDGGKGKITDVGAQYADMVVRYSGGGNAGHTVVNPLGEFKLHLIPSGIFHLGTVNVIADAVVIDPFLLSEEISALKRRGISVSSRNLRISENCHLIMPWHKLRDGLSEKARGRTKIGTTGKGIGPVYSDRAARTGLRIKDLYKSDFRLLFQQEANWQEKLVRLLNGGNKKSYFDAVKLFDELISIGQLLSPFITNTLPLIWKYQDTKKNILAEGAQGALLDLDLGGFPFVTSSHPGVAGFTVSTGIHADAIRNVIGVAKAYSTRVGGGPMPAELTDEAGKYLQKRGQEVGTTTGRVRRCGWFDTLAVKFGARIAGVRSLAITKLDVLDSLLKVKICTAYRADGKIVTSLPSADPEFMLKVKPIYETIEGWREDTKAVRSFSKLPKQAKRYIRRIEQLTGLPVDIVSVGAHREATIYKI